MSGLAGLLILDSHQESFFFFYELLGFGVGVFVVVVVVYSSFSVSPAPISFSHLMRQGQEKDSKAVQ